MRARDRFQEMLRSKFGKSARASMHAFAQKAALVIALLVNTVCLLQAMRLGTEPLTEGPEKWMQQAALESLLREGSTLEIQAAARSQAEVDFEARNVRFEIAGHAIKRVVLNETEAELFLDGLPISETVALLKETGQLTGKDEIQAWVRFNFNRALLDKQAALQKSRETPEACIAGTPSLKLSYLADPSLAPRAVIYADAYNTRMICLIKPEMMGFLAEKHEGAPAEKVSLLDVLLQLGSYAQIEEAAKESAAVVFDAGHLHFKMAGTNKLNFSGITEQQFNRIERLKHSFHAERKKRGLEENVTDPLAGEFNGALPYGCTNPLAHRGISYASAYNKRMVEMLLQWSRAGAR